MKTKALCIVWASLLSCAVCIAADEDRLTRHAGPHADGKTGVTPMNWTLDPAGEQIKVGDWPFGAALSPDGKRLAVTNNGMGLQSISMIDTATLQVRETVLVRRPQSLFLGLAWSADGTRLYASGGSSNMVGVFDTSGEKTKQIAKIEVCPTELGQDGKPKTARMYCGGLALSPDGKRLFVAEVLNNSVTVIDTQSNEVRTEIPVKGNPYTVIFSPDGAKAYVSSWGGGTVTVIDTATEKAGNTIATGDHPCAMALTPDGTRLLVCNANSDTVSVIDTAADRVVHTISLQPYPDAPFGSMPNACCVTRDGRTLYVANAGNNDVAAISLVDRQWGAEQVKAYGILGIVPTAWFPSAVSVMPDGNRLLVTCAKGLGAGQNADPKMYIGFMLHGIVCAPEISSPEQLAQYTTRAAQLNGFVEGKSVRPTASSEPSAIPRRVGEPSPIKYVVYIIKENRTYDQVLGDLPQGNGVPELCYFGREVSPNHHAIAEEYVLLDNFYVDGSVSADGHQWSCGAIATDAMEKTWQASYSKRGPGFGGPIVYPSAGYIWDLCAANGITHRTYGEMEGVTANKDNACPDYVGWDLKTPGGDQRNADVFLRELSEFEKAGEMPRFIIMSLPQDHTGGTVPGWPTPKACVADNDLALGRIVEGLSKSRFWPEMAVFVVEDDAQAGPDHVDAHRTVALVASPYCKRGIVDSTFYDTASMLRTIELILGLPPMTQFDAAATPMVNCLTNQPDLSPYACKPNMHPIDELNPQAAYGAEKCIAMDWTDFDKAPWDELNRILWHSIKGPDAPYPTPHTSRGWVVARADDD